MSHILAIETSCDETAAAVIKKTAAKAEILSSVVASQIAIHRKYGGVVPEVAARHHAENIIGVIDAALHKANVALKKIDQIAVTAGPGLLTSLLVGVQTGQALGVALNKPVVAVNHLEGHIVSAFAGMTFAQIKKRLPAVALIASGGHTELLLIKKLGSYRLLGATRDDAAGECFDKVAKLLGLKYPGGPEIAKKAANGNPTAFAAPRPMIDRPGYEFSFSGLKTWALYYQRDHGPLKGKRLNDFCASIEQAIVDVLIKKTTNAATQYKAKSIIIGGGVAANKQLREQLTAATDTPVLIPPLSLCSDNAAMIGLAAALAPRSAKQITVDPNASL